MPIETRIRLFVNDVTSKLIQSHRKPRTDKISSIHQSKAWNDWCDGTFNSDDRAIALGLSADGLNPFAKEKNSYSMWPIIALCIESSKSNVEETEFHAVNRNNSRTR